MIRSVGHNAIYSTEALELVALRSYIHDHKEPALGPRVAGTFCSEKNQYMPTNFAVHMSR